VYRQPGAVSHGSQPIHRLRSGNSGPGRCRSSWGPTRWACGRRRVAGR
jgi:hypothetical protein